MTVQRCNCCADCCTYLFATILVAKCDWWCCRAFKRNGERIQTAFFGMFSNQISVVVKGKGFALLADVDCLWLRIYLYGLVRLSVCFLVHWSVWETFFELLLFLFCFCSLHVVSFSFCALLSCVFYAFCQHFVSSCCCVFFHCARNCL